MDKIKQYNEIDQSLYSRRTIKKDSVRDMFFGDNIGSYNSKGELVTRADTNTCNYSTLSSIMYLVSGIKFIETELDLKVRKHLLEYAYFVFRVGDKDYLTFPLHLMMNYMYFLQKELTIPVPIDAHYNFQVQLDMTKSYNKDFYITCELLGVMRRPD